MKESLVYPFFNSCKYHGSTKQAQFLCFLNCGYIKTRRSLLLHYIYINFLDIFVLVSKALRKCWSKQPTTITILWFFLKGSIFNQFISTGFIVSYSISRKPKVKSQLLEADRECVSKVCAKLSWEY